MPIGGWSKTVLYQKKFTARETVRLKCLEHPGFYIFARRMEVIVEV